MLEKEFAELLRRRRTDLRPYWEATVPRRVKAWERAGWYADCDLLMSLSTSDLTQSSENRMRQFA